MKKGKFQSNTSRHIRGSSRSIALILAMMLLVGGVIGGTVAWLVSTSDTVVNTFTYGDIDIKLEESDNGLDGDNNKNTNQYAMIPGSKLNKDPLITVLEGSESSYVFVKLEKSENFDDFLTYEMADGWLPVIDLDGNTVEGVYYTTVDAKDCKEEDVLFGVLKDNQVTVKGTVTKEQLNALDAEGAKNYPTLSITAYAVQKDNIPTAADAWEIVNNPSHIPETTPVESEPAASEGGE